MFPGNNDTSLVIIGILGMLILAIAFIAAIFYSQRKKTQHQLELQQLKQTEQNKLIEAAVRSEESERHRIAEELHDEVGAILSATRLHFSALDRHTMSKNDIQIHERSKQLLDDSIQKVRSISHNLHSSILKELGLHEAIRHFIGSLTKGTAIRTNFTLDDTYKTLNADRDISIYRLIQELVNNLLKYAQPKEININSTLNTQELFISIDHNGNGLNQDEFEKLRYSSKGLGLKNIQNRIIMLKGSIEFIREENGCHIYLHIPITK